MTVKLGAKLPKDSDHNGLQTAELYRQFLTDPGTPVMAICLLQTSKSIKDYDNYDTVPVVTVRAIKVVGADDRGRLRAMLVRRHEERTGNLELPAEWEEILTSMVPAAPRLPGTDR